MPSSSAYIIIAHGSRDSEANEAFFEFVGKFRKAFPKRKVQEAFLELANPQIPQAIEKCVAAGAKELFILPLMLFPGLHVKEHIPAIIEAAKAKHPAVDFHYGRPLSDCSGLGKIVEEQAKAIKRKKK